MTASSWTVLLSRATVYPPKRPMEDIMGELIDKVKGNVNEAVGKAKQQQRRPRHARRRRGAGRQGQGPADSAARSRARSATISDAASIGPFGKPERPFRVDARWAPRPLAADETARTIGAFARCRARLPAAVSRCDEIAASPHPSPPVVTRVRISYRRCSRAGTSVSRSPSGVAGRRRSTTGCMAPIASMRTAARKLRVGAVARRRRFFGTRCRRRDQRTP